jgi:two-component system nitrate/nitrite response regulator NarL
MPERIRVAVVDNHPLFRDGVVTTVNDTTEFEVVAQGECGSDAVHIAQQLLPDIILLDANMPVSGIEAAREISKRCPSVKTIMLTSLEGTEHVTAAREAGARFCLTKGISAHELLGTLRFVHFEADGAASHRYSTGSHP